MSELFYSLLESGKFTLAIWETVYMTVLSVVFSYVIGLPLGIILTITDKDGLKQNLWVNRILGFIVNVLRSIPFIILMVAMLPVSKFLIGTSLGNGAMIIMLTISASPYIARMVESSLKEMDKGVIEAARAMGASDLEIIFKVILPESKPSLIVGAVISTVTVIGYTAMASTIGGGGVGALAINYGHQRFKDDIIWVCVLVSVIFVQVVQEVGMRIAKRVDKRIANKRQNKKQKIENKKFI